MNLRLNLKLESVESDIPEKKVTALLKNFNLQINCKKNMLKNVYKGNKIKLPLIIIVKEKKSQREYINLFLLGKN